MFVDLYELTMAQAYLRQGMRRTAVFETHFRVLPPGRSYIVAAGLGPLLEALETLRFEDHDLAYLADQRLFSNELLDFLASFQFTGDIDAPPEGTILFPHEPMLQVAAPLPQAQLIETLVLNQLHGASLAASKAARMVQAAQGRPVIDFGARRAHGADAAVAAARSAYLAGFKGTSLLEAGRRFGIPISGTMAHSFIQAHNNQKDAFAAYLDAFPGSTLLVDTYDTFAGVRDVIALCQTLDEPTRPKAIRLDSGDLAELSRQSRAMLVEAGLGGIKIIASGGLDEYAIARLVAGGAPIDGFGVGTALAVSDDAPALDLAYKLVEYAGTARTKLSPGKTIYPGRKQVFRHADDGRFTGDRLAAAGTSQSGEPLLQPVFRGGRRLDSFRPTLEDSRAHCRRQLEALPPSLLQIERSSEAYPVVIDAELEAQLQTLRHQDYGSSG